MTTADEWRTIHNLLTGEVLTFLETSGDRMVNTPSRIGGDPGNEPE